MKRLFIIFFCALIYAANADAQVCSPKAFRININEMIPRRFPTKNVASDFSLELRNDSAIVYMPYAGVVHTPSFDNDGLHFNEPVKDLKIKRNKKNTATELVFNVQHNMISYTFRVTAFDGESADIDVMPSNGDGCSYYGDWENIDVKNDTK